MDDIVIVEVVHCIQDLSNCLRCIFFCELAVVADSIEKLPACRELSNNIIFVLSISKLLLT